MRRVIAMVVAIAVLTLLGPGTAGAAAGPFKDVHGVLAPEIARAHAEGLVSGYSDGTFKPNNPITRAEFAKLVVVMVEKVIGRPLPAPDFEGDLFRDVNRDHPLYRYLHKAHRFGYIFGDMNGRFYPDRPIKRWEAAEILGVAIRHALPERVRPAGFPDVDPSSGYAEVVSKLAAAGVMKGYKDGRFHPDASLPRAQAAAVIVRAYDVRRSRVPELGSWENPVPIGREFQLKSWWRLTVLDITEDAWPQIREADPANKPPVPGRQYVMARIRATYIGDKLGNSRWPGELHFGYEGFDGVSYGRWEPEGKGSCGTIPDDLLAHGALRPGETVEGNVCWAVPKDVIKGGLINVFDAGAEHFMGPVWAYFAGVPR
ncbi:MAG: hypothetical protein DIU69_11315 [Bacillota bacterium]|nr:MAG: hypothetical protein DIU69_11315 [Bacillota bacterium]